MKKIIKLLVTFSILAAAGYFGYKKYEAYIQNPWTRDGQVRTQVIQVAPRVSGMVTKIYVKDNQYVQKGDMLFEIDDSKYKFQVAQAQARLKRAREVSKGAKVEYERVKSIFKRDRGAVSQKDLIRNEVNYYKSLADIDAQKEQLNIAKLNLSFTKVRAEVEGWVSNINFQLGTQAVANKPILALVDKNSFWVFGFFREDMIKDIKEGDAAVVTLMAYPDKPLQAKVESIAWGIYNTDANPGKNLLPNVKPVFQWIRLAQRIPVRLELEAPLREDVVLRYGMSASVMIKTEAK
jgi:RND family efflux transporter MFP subunit